MAHSRRRRENDTFSDMAEVLPIQENAKDLDKASILRVAINYLKLRELIGEKDGEDSADTEAEAGSEERAGDLSTQIKKEEVDDFDTGLEIAKSSEDASTQLPNFARNVLQALDGFMLVISSDGRILYTSESISTYLGLRQVDVIGISIHDIVHPQDISELATIFKSQGKDTEHVFDRSDPLKRNFVVRMRCAFTPSVRSIARCSNFKPIYCSASLKFGKTEQTRGKFQGVVALCKLASVSRIKEMCVGAFFKTKHSLDLGYTGIDTRIRWILGYDPTEMMGHKAYQYFHPQDLTATSSCHMNLLSQGHSHSPCYRFMSRWGDWLWVRSKSYVTYNPISHMPDGLLIYTWIVRLEEDDERMKAIQAGKGVVEKIYNNLGSNISTEGGSLDIGKLADPNAGSDDCEPAPPAPQKATRPAVIEKRESGYMSSSSYPSPHSSAVPSPPLTVTTPPESVPYTPQQFTSSMCGSPESQSNSCQSSLQTGFYGSAPSLQTSQMPSPPYTPAMHDQSPTQFVDPSIMGSNYQGFTPDPMVPVSSTYPQQYSPDQQQRVNYGAGLYMQQCPLPAAQSALPNPLLACNINPTFSMQATVITASPSEATLYYQPPNLTDLQFPAEPQRFSSYNAMPGNTGGNAMEKVYVSNARERYNRGACAVPGVHVGSKRPRENPSEWSSQWLQGAAPPAHVY